MKKIKRIIAVSLIACSLGATPAFANSANSGYICDGEGHCIIPRWEPRPKEEKKGTSIVIKDAEKIIIIEKPKDIEIKY